MKTGVHILAKAPIAGWANTRLAKTIGKEAAARLADALIRDALSAVKAADVSDFRLWIGVRSDIEVCRQITEYKRICLCEVLDIADLGPAMAEACARGFEMGWDRAVVLGVDSPLAVSRHLREGIGLLKESPAVLGPTKDGGVYLIGLHRNFDRSIWTEVRWGTASVYKDLSRFFPGAAHLPLSYDVDTAEDLGELRRDLTDPSHAPMTAALLSEIP